MKSIQLCVWKILLVLISLLNMQASLAQTMSKLDWAQEPYKWAQRGRDRPKDSAYTREDSVQELFKWMQRGEDHPEDSTSGRALTVYYAEEAAHLGKSIFSPEIHSAVLTK